MKKYLTILFLFGFWFYAYSQSEPDMVARIRWGEKAKAVERLKPLRLTFEDVSDNSAQVLIKRNQLDRLREMGFEIEILYQDSRIRAAEWKAAMGERWTSYSSVVTQLVNISTAHPNICRLHNIGKTVQNRDIYVMEITDNPDTDETDEAEVRMIGNIHGDEYVSMELMVLLIQYLVDNYNVNTTVTKLINNREIWIQPSVNPDGHELGTRRNANGVDMNRNHGYMWDGEGSTPFSEMELQHFRDYSLKRNFSMSLTFHGVTTYFNYPWNFTGYNAFDKNHFTTLGNKYKTWTNYTVVEGYDWYQICGDTNDWSYGCRGDFDITIETYGSSSSGVTTDWNLNRDAILYIIDQADYGLAGVVTSSSTGQPLEALVRVKQHPIMVYTDPLAGDYHRPLQGGTYEVNVWANGYEPKTVSNIAVVTNQKTIQNVQLTPNNQFYAMHMCWNIPDSTYIYSADSWYGIWPHEALGPADNVPGSLGRNGTLCLDMGQGFEIKNGSGNDVKVYEADVGDGNEAYELYGSTNDFLGPWKLIGSGTGSKEFDIGAVGLSVVRYFKIVDKTSGAYLVNYPGFDLDAIGAIGGLTPPTRDQFLGSFSGYGLWSFDPNTNTWSKLNDLTATQIRCGDFDGNKKDDVLGTWNIGIWIRYDSGVWAKILDNTGLAWLGCGDMNGDGKADFIGSFTSPAGIWVRDTASGAWTKLHDTAAGMLSGGDFDGNGKSDLLGSWSGLGVWILYDNGTWSKTLDDGSLKYLTAGDMDGDKKADVLGSWTYGVWTKSSLTGSWVRLHESGAEQIASGDLDGDGKADLIGNWSGIAGIWVRYATGAWARIYDGTAVSFTAGKIK